MILAREVRKDVHFVQSDLRDLLLRRSPACPGCDEVSLVKRGWECPAQMSKFTKFCYSLIGSTFLKFCFDEPMGCINLESTSEIKGEVFIVELMAHN